MCGKIVQTTAEVYLRFYIIRIILVGTEFVNDAIARRGTLYLYLYYIAISTPSGGLRQPDYVLSNTKPPCYVSLFFFRFSVA